MSSLEEVFPGFKKSSDENKYIESFKCPVCDCYAGICQKCEYSCLHEKECKNGHKWKEATKAERRV